MKKIFLGTLLLAFVLLPIKTNALTGTVGLTCSKTKLSPNETTTCNLTFNTQESINAVRTQLTAESGLTIESVTTASGWMGEGESNLQLYTEENKTGNIAIATIKIKAGNTIGTTKKLNATGIVFTDLQYNETSFDDISENIRIPSNINSLNSLSIQNVNDTQNPEQQSTDNLDIAFEPNKLEYSISAGEGLEKVVINATLTSDVSSFVDGYGPRNVELHAGENKIEVKVKAENDSVRTYTITIKKPGTAPETVTNNKSSENIGATVGTKDENVKVEDTSKTMSKIVYIISGIFFICGFGIIIYSVIQKKIINKSSKNEIV